MRFSAIFFSIVALGGLVLASPVEERGPGLGAVESVHEPKFEAAKAQIHPSAAAHIFGNDGATGGKPASSRRSEHNELEDRTTSYATLILCTGRGCSGRCSGYYLPVNPYTCYGSITYNSLYVSATSGLTYGVFVGSNCYGSLRPHLLFRGFSLV